MKRIAAMALAMTLALGLTACGGTTEETPSPSSTASTLEGVVNLDGSTSMEKVVKILMESFEEEYPSVSLNYNASGSSSGIASAVNGTADLGLSSRALKTEEEEQGAQAHVIALDGVAVVIHPENPVSDLTVEQIAGLFTGTITNWSEVGGVDAPIAAVGREPGSGTRGAFEEIVGVEDACVYAAEYSSTGDVIGNVASNPNSIGYASLSAVSDQVKAVSVNGVACSEETVQNGTFPIQRPFLMVTGESTEPSDAAQAFLDYAMSEEVAGLIEQAGAVAPAGQE